MKRTRGVRILFLVADPSNASRLRLGQEIREVEERLKLARMGSSFSLITRMSVRPGDVTQAIFDTNPQIVHFSGHGMNTGELCFEDEAGTIQSVSPDALASLFELISSQVQCVVLNACYSEIQARVIAKHIDFVVGMNEAIGDKAAITFASGFYKALGAGRSVEDAYNFGIVELKLLSIPEYLTPVLIKKNANKSIVLNEWDDYTSKKYIDYTVFSMDFGFRSKSPIILMNPSAYYSIRSMLDDLFINYLSNIVKPYSYGEEWIIAGEPSSTRILAPFSWISNPGSPITELDPTWFGLNPYYELDIKPNTRWEICIRDGVRSLWFQSTLENLYAFASNNEELAKLLLSNAKAVAFLYEKNYFSFRSLDEFDAQKYKFKYVFRDWLGMGLKGTVLEGKNEKVTDQIKSILQW
ncbi:CHAT domain-containing protein [Nostoc sp. NMS9]|uniref:CHAT domain-containing protein n=1 Tax=Nostoc sp. NMS9 TaxID=2815393 RepID=UPI0025F18AA2|nr:CHAT domain-containing protein [Nostoc sp. NMS9]MBN3939997.1 CHAT domain-containing protein [Nostoc sp. NMS9]